MIHQQINEFIVFTQRGTSVLQSCEKSDSSFLQSSMEARILGQLAY